MKWSSKCCTGKSSTGKCSTVCTSNVYSIRICSDLALVRLIQEVKDSVQCSYDKTKKYFNTHKRYVVLRKLTKQSSSKSK